ncbi:MAG: IclR family transcriptional regulator [Desulfobacteraceae bacterium]
MVRSAERLLNILLLFSHKNPLWGVTDISKATKIPKTTVYNLLRTLENKGFVKQDKQTLKYILGPKLLSLGSTMIETLEINQKAIGPAHRLAERTSLNCKVAIWDHDAIIVTVDIGAYHTGFLSKRLGPRLIAYCSALGRPFLAYMEPQELESYLEDTELTAFTPNTITDKEQLLRELEDVRLLGYSINNEEINLGTSSIGVPIFNRELEVTASMCLEGPSDVVLGKNKEFYIKEIKHTAIEISVSMGWRAVSAGEIG